MCRAIECEVDVQLKLLNNQSKQAANAHFHTCCYNISNIKLQQHGTKKELRSRTQQNVAKQF